MPCLQDFPWWGDVSFAFYKDLLGVVPKKLGQRGFSVSYCVQMTNNGLEWGHGIPWET